jgi:hypothetical protein
MNNIQPGKTYRTPFELSGLVEALEIEGNYPGTDRKTVRVRFVEDHPHGYYKDTIGRYFADELREENEIISESLAQ